MLLFRLHVTLQKLQRKSITLWQVNTIKQCPSNKIKCMRKKLKEPFFFLFTFAQIIFPIVSVSEKSLSLPSVCIGSKMKMYLALSSFCWPAAVFHGGRFDLKKLMYLIYFLGLKKNETIFDRFSAKLKNCWINVPHRPRKMNNKFTDYCFYTEYTDVMMSLVSKVFTFSISTFNPWLIRNL